MKYLKFYIPFIGAYFVQKDLESPESLLRMDGDHSLILKWYHPFLLFTGIYLIFVHGK